MPEPERASMPCELRSVELFPIAAVGASAGGLAATTELLRALGPDPGLAVVVIHHLDPSHESGLVEILARSTAMPVAAAADGSKVERNHVYVLPPNAALLISAGVLQVVPRTEDGGLHLPIDRFCESLALDRATLSVGVVLSGTGYDGTEGLRAIKRVGGITLAQDGSAAFAGMPESAIQAHCVDVVAAPAELAQVLRRVGANATQRFREAGGLEALRKFALPKLCENRSSQSPLRIWVPGCSTGEEVYSIAMCLLEFLEAARLELRIKIFATDLSQGIVEKARAGRYPRNIEGDVSEARLQRFFTKYETEYQIRREVRDSCVFAKHDVTRDPPFSGMDLISCRNLLIYPGAELQDRVVALFHYALKEPGFLMLGGAESVRSFVGFTPVDAKNKLYARTSAGPRALFDFGAPSPWQYSAHQEELAGAPSEASQRSGSSSDIHREADRLVLAEFGPPGVVVTSDLAIVQFRGQTGSFLEPAPGAASLDLFHMAREELRLPLRHALDNARQSRAPVTEEGVTLSAGGQQRRLTLRVVPFAVGSPQQRCFLVLFEDSRPPEATAEPRVGRASGSAPVESDASLRQELASTRQYLESVTEQLEATNEELKAANEAVVSSNEELRSTNEELQSAKEELRASNEELRAVNDELGQRNAEGIRLSDDLTNLLNSAEIPILIVGRDARLRSFTPAAGKTFGLVANDRDRPWNDVKALASFAPTLAQLMGEVREKLTPATGILHAAHDAWFELTARPYITLDGRIDGTVVVARDVSVENRAAEGQEAARRYAENVVDTVRDGLLVLDGALCVSTANAAFGQQFRLDAASVRGKRLSELGHPELTTPALQQVLALIQQGKTVEGVRVEPSGVVADARVYLLNGRRIGGTELMLLAFADITATERARAATARAELVFRGVLTAAEEAILIVDALGQILFANPAAAKVFGYQDEELNGQTVDLLVPDLQRNAHTLSRANYLSAAVARPMGKERPLVGRRKDGTEVPIEVSLSPMEHQGGVAAVAFVTDMTQRREAERRLQVYQERIRRMGFDAALTEERERRRIAIGLHDHVGQALALAQLKLGSARAELPAGPGAAVDSAVQLLDEAIQAQRSLVFELSPPVLYDLGLGAALNWLAEDVAKRFGVQLEIQDDGEGKPLSDAAKTIVFRGVRELVMNVLKHARVPTATISLSSTADGVNVAVEDHGVGFEPVELSKDGFGLLSVREQIQALGGSLEVQSAAQRGTLVTLRVPLKEAEPNGGAATSDAGGAA